MKTFLIITGTIVAIIIAIDIVYYIKHPCLEYTEEIIHHPSWIQPIYNGKFTTVIYHPAQDKLEKTCIKR